MDVYGLDSVSPVKTDSRISLGPLIVFLSPSRVDLLCRRVFLDNADVPVGDAAWSELTVTFSIATLHVGGSAWQSIHGKNVAIQHYAQPFSPPAWVKVPEGQTDPHPHPPEDERDEPSQE